MAVTVRHTGLSTEAVREMAVALHKVGLTAQLKVGVEGPEKWVAETPPMTPNQFADVVAEVTHMNWAADEHGPKQRYSLSEFIEQAKRLLPEQHEEIKQLKKAKYANELEIERLARVVREDNTEIKDLKARIEELERNGEAEG